MKPSAAQKKYIADHYATAPMAEMVEHLGVSRDSIKYYAHLMGKRRDRACYGLYPLVEEVLSDNEDWKISQIVEATGAGRSAIRKVLIKMCNLQEAHVPRWEPMNDQPWNVEAIFKRGPGVTAPKPAQYIRAPKVKEPEAYPVPRPKLGLWGLVWNIANQSTGEQA